MTFNPLTHLETEAAVELAASEFESTSALINDTMGMCPKCQQPFGNALVDNVQVFYCEPCRVSQPLPV
jgi:predicted  nucleic acid-binding Zn ribbon protein